MHVFLLKACVVSADLSIRCLGFQVSYLTSSIQRSVAFTRPDSFLGCNPYRSNIVVWNNAKTLAICENNEIQALSVCATNYVMTTSERKYPIQVPARIREIDGKVLFLITY
jgi:hypothetical protein